MALLNLSLQHDVGELRACGVRCRSHGVQIAELVERLRREDVAACAVPSMADVAQQVPA
ncbi:MAG: hypothetical protein ABWZ88_18815 [Variovorax sp.]